MLVGFQSVWPSRFQVGLKLFLFFGLFYWRSCVSRFPIGLERPVFPAVSSRFQVGLEPVFPAVIYCRSYVTRFSVGLEPAVFPSVSSRFGVGLAESVSSRFAKCDLVSTKCVLFNYHSFHWPRRDSKSIACPHRLTTIDYKSIT